MSAETLTITTLQQRIEQEAEIRLLNDLFEASERERLNCNQFGKFGYEIQLDVFESYEYSGRKYVKLRNELAKNLFREALPNYIKIVTDEILQKIKEMDYLLQSTNDEN